jgi:hypothetical protein
MTTPIDAAMPPRRLAILLREIDSALVGGIVAAVLYFALAQAGMRPDPEAVRAALGRFLGVSAPLFGAAAAFLLWVSGALLVETLSLAEAPRRWTGIAAALFYVENAAPFVGLLECFVSIVKALLAYSAAGGTTAAQTVLISNIAVALGASAAGCFVALCAHSLKAVVVHRAEAP